MMRILDAWQHRKGLLLLLLAAWLMMNNTLAIGHLILGFILASVIAAYAPRFDQPPLRIRRLPTLLAYGALLLWDIVRANLTVARQILGPLHTLRPTFLEIPLNATHPLVVSLFASTITLTPGTVSCELSADGRVLRVHALHSADPAADIVALKARYEVRLMAIFEDPRSRT